MNITYSCAEQKAEIQFSSLLGCGHPGTDMVDEQTRKEL
jgi:hypothetical protein